MGNLIRRWLGVPTRAEIREMILREIDADAVWRDGNILHRTFEFQRADKERARKVAVLTGKRENTRD